MVEPTVAVLNHKVPSTGKEIMGGQQARECVLLRSVAESACRGLPSLHGTWRLDVGKRGGQTRMTSPASGGVNLEACHAGGVGWSRAQRAVNFTTKQHPRR